MFGGGNGLIWTRHGTLEPGSDHEMPNPHYIYFNLAGSMYCFRFGDLGVGAVTPPPVVRPSGNPWNGGFPTWPKGVLISLARGDKKYFGLKIHPPPQQWFSWVDDRVNRQKSAPLLFFLATGP